MGHRPRAQRHVADTPHAARFFLLAVFTFPQIKATFRVVQGCSQLSEADSFPAETQRRRLLGPDEQLFLPFSSGRSTPETPARAGVSVCVSRQPASASAQGLCVKARTVTDTGVTGEGRT